MNVMRSANAGSAAADRHGQLTAVEPGCSLAQLGRQSVLRAVTEAQGVGEVVKRIRIEVHDCLTIKLREVAHRPS